MKRKLVFLRFLGMLCLFTLIIARPVWAEKKWSIKSVEIAARIDSAGYMTIEEKRTYEFFGKFSYAYYDLSLAGLLEVDQIQVLEDGMPYQLAEDKSPGTFFFTHDGKQISIRWQFRENAGHASGNGLIREFTLRFRVLGAVRVHRDTAELYYKFVGTGWDRASERVRVLVRLPGAIGKDELRVWAHGPLHGYIERQADGTVNMSIDHLPARQFLEARLVFPARYLPAAITALHDDQEALPAILQQEAQWAEAANLEREKKSAHQKWQAANREKYSSWLWIGIGAGIVFFFYMYQRYGRSFQSRRKVIDSTLPTDMPPAVANYLLNAHQLTGGALLATLFDLAARGYLRLQQEKTVFRWLGFSSTKWETTIFFDEDKLRFAQAELLPYERQFLEFLHNDLAQNRAQLALSEIKKHASQFRRFFGKWKEAVATQAGKPKLYETASIRASLITFGIWVILIVAYAFGIHAMGATAAPFLIISILLAPFSFMILRYHPEMAKKLDRLQSFRRYLKRFPQRHQQYGVDWQQFDKLVIYAAALGLSSSETKQLVDMAESEQYHVIFPWFIYSHGGATPDIGAAMASMVEVVGSTLSSASGAGGGASSGGGGGAGGSGGGAG
ncbi:MAG: DUF2207 domain-containing protein [candidate division KSB1 bacterium]|nr:DUF2207 domain-containing protein [candidate division KSB1 bacterium]MDZ7301702.1 DUF2207 domain-containing protein [candidate division KSB1 bacterium]MDZ7312411.1 DUF2207 domain-containing protein [candidate division KSB1 bacterium]